MIDSKSKTDSNFQRAVSQIALERQLVALVQRRDIKQNQEQPRQHIFRFFRSCDFFVVASLCDCFRNKIADVDQKMP